MKLIKETEAGLLKFTDITAVSGNTLAEILDARHSNVMRVIRRVMKHEKDRKEDASEVSSPIIQIEEQKSPNFNAVFKEWEYTSSQNKKYKTYIMNEDALYLVIANMKGQKAHNLKVWFKSEFNKMRIELQERKLSKSVARPMTDQVKVLQGMLKDEKSGAAPHIYTTIAKQIHRAATGRPMKAKGIDHETLTAEENLMVSELRHNVEYMIEYMIKEGKSGREIRDAVKAFLHGVMD